MEKELNVVGSRVPMLDAAQKAKGAALFRFIALLMIGPPTLNQKR